MNQQELKTVFQEEILPRLGGVHKPEVYWDLVVNLAGAEELRESDLPEDLRPATHFLNKLIKIGVVEYRLPLGTAKMLLDPINNKRTFWNKHKMIEDYYYRMITHLEKNEVAMEIAKDAAGETDDDELIGLLNELSEGIDFEIFNKIVFELLGNGIQTQDECYGPLEWRFLAKLYSLTDKRLRLEESSGGKNGYI